MTRKPDAGITALCEVLAGLHTADEMTLALEDLCTIQELLALSQRLMVAKLLKDGKNYAEINQETGVSSATISRVNRCLNYGAGGYTIMLNQMKEDTP